MAAASNVLADGREKDRIAGYTKHWQKDLKTDNKTDSRLDSYTEVVNGTALPYS